MTMTGSRQLPVFLGRAILRKNPLLARGGGTRRTQETCWFLPQHSSRKPGAVLHRLSYSTHALSTTYEDRERHPAMQDYCPAWMDTKTSRSFITSIQLFTHATTPGKVASATCTSPKKSITCQEPDSLRAARMVASQRGGGMTAPLSS